MSGTGAGFGWGAIARLGLVQFALGAVVVLTTSTFNRVMVVELALPALLPGLLVAWHYAVQMLRPRLGHGSDVGGRRTPWIVGGVAVLATGGLLTALAVAWMASNRPAGIALALVGFALVGIGVSAAGTSLLALVAKRVAPERRAGAATVLWLMMIVGIALTAGISGRHLDPYSPERLVAVTAVVALVSITLAAVAMAGLEGPAAARTLAPAQAQQPFREVLAGVWADAPARRFTVFVFVSMLAFSAQDLILEPFAGTVFGLTPGQSTSLSGVQHGGVLLGMLAAAFAGRRRMGSLRVWTIGGCLASAVVLAALATAGTLGPPFPLRATVFALGAANGAFSIAAIGSMMHLAGDGPDAREGVRMGLWGAAQAIAFALGGLLGTGASDLARWWVGQPGPAYGLVFGAEALLFLLSAALAARVESPVAGGRTAPATAARLAPAAEIGGPR